MSKLIGAGLFAVLLAFAFGIAQFFGIINADAFLHPTSAYKHAKVVLGVKPKPPEQIIKVYPEKGCKDKAPLTVVWSLRHQPDRWHKQYCCTLVATGLEMWIGNGVGHLDINDAFPYSDQCRNLLWSAVSVWTNNRVDREVEEFTQ